MTKKEKKLIDKEILDIVIFHLKILKIEISKKNIKMAIVMFIEGVKYIKERKKK